MDILNSWKEIAAYLGRGVRTAQRWERDFGLPVHRPKGTDRSAVLAFPYELELWLYNTPVRSQVGAESLVPNFSSPQERTPSQTSLGGVAPRAFSPVLARVESSMSDVQNSLDRAHDLRAQLAEAVHRQRVLTDALHASLQKTALQEMARRRARGAAA